MSARVVVDYGEQMVQASDGTVRFADVLLLSCGCRVEVDHRHVLLMRRPDEEWGAAVALLEATHECAPKMLAEPQKALRPA